MFFLKIPTVKNVSPGGKELIYLRGSIVPTYTKNICYLTIAIINKCFEFQNDWLKTILLGTTTPNFVLYRCVKKNHKFRTTSELFERYAPKYYQHQIISKCN